VAPTIGVISKQKQERGYRLSFLAVSTHQSKQPLPSIGGKKMFSVKVFDGSMLVCWYSTPRKIDAERYMDDLLNRKFDLEELKHLRVEMEEV